MSRKGLSPLLMWALVALPVVAGGVFFVSRLEKVAEKVKFGPSAEARANPRLAAVKLLERFGLTVRAVRDPAVLPAKGALVMLPSSVHLDPGRVARWRSWVEDGGILMLSLGIAPESREPLLAGVAGVRKFAQKKDGEQKDGEKPEGEAEAGVETVDPETAEAHDEIGAADAEDPWSFAPLGGSGPDVRLAMRPKWVIPRADFNRCEAGYYVDEGGVVAIYALGEGHLVLLADDSIFDNGRIAGADHALFLWHLVKYFPAPPEVVVLLGDRVGLLAWLWREARPLLLTLLALTLIFIWEKAPRFGPLVERKRPGQRGLRAHLRAASAFLWRQHEQVALLEPLRAEVLRRARAAIPGWTAFSHEKARAELARLSHLPEPAIDAALRGDPGRDPRHFTVLVATLETLRKAL